MEYTGYIDSILMLLGCIGFTLASFIYSCKRQQKPLVCPLRANCELVTHSVYSKVLGLPIELLGMGYYAFIVIFHGFVFANPGLLDLVGMRVSLVTSLCAFLFSLYLVSIQTFVLKQWCTWCLCSAGICALIFLLTFFSLPAGIF